jgi:TorA maturation chaperone TorD
MSPEEKGAFCQLMASLFSPPDREIIQEVLDGRPFNFFKHYAESWGRDESPVKGFVLDGHPEKIFEELRAEYHHLFEDEAGEKISLIESFYKPWTRDALCPLPFAKEKGYLMGDSALHLLTLYQNCGLEVSDPFKGMPDHLVLELEFLSFLYQNAGDREIRRVIEDHFDWIPLLQEECEKARAHPFYLTLIDLLQLFINSEKERWENEEHGEKEIHSEVL